MPFNLTQVKQRPRIVLLLTALTCGAVVFLFYATLHEWQQNSLGISDRVADSVGVMVAISFGFFVNHIFSSAMYEDVSFRLHTSQQRFDQKISDSETVIDIAANDLSGLPALTKLLNEQLHLITVETERSAFDIMERLQAIDAEISELLSTVTASAQDADDKIHTSQTLSSMLMDILASIQFQDVTRQQIEHVQNALTRLDNHVARLVEMMRSKNYSYSASIKDHIEQIYEGYVMEQQRDVHTSATGNNVDSEGGVASQKIELF